MFNRIKSFFIHPLARHIDMDPNESISEKKKIILHNRFLNRIYTEWYEELASLIPMGSGSIIELGTGPGFLEQFIPHLITSDIVFHKDINIVFDGSEFPFHEKTLKAVVMTNVFHHLRKPERFLKEAGRHVKPGGIIGMIEPWRTFWSQIIYSRFHHEPFHPSIPGLNTTDDQFSGANGALPWIVFERDIKIFRKKFPEWRLVEVKPFMPFRYILSGGVSLKHLMPYQSFAFWKNLENFFLPFMKHIAMFAKIHLERI